MFWEICSLGKHPYDENLILNPCVNGNDLKILKDKNLRMSLIENLPNSINFLIYSCLLPDPKLRSNFNEIKSNLEACLSGVFFLKNEGVTLDTMFRPEIYDKNNSALDNLTELCLDFYRPEQDALTY